jgi:hypothetical protein
MKETKLPPRLTYMTVEDTATIDESYGYGYRHGYVAGYLLVISRWQEWSRRSLQGEGQVEMPSIAVDTDMDLALELNKKLDRARWRLTLDSMVRSLLFSVLRRLGMKSASQRYTRCLELGARDGLEETQILCLAWHKTAYLRQGKWSGARPF